MCSEHVSTVDLIGIGFGPSNLALAIAIEEYNAHSDAPLTASFVERRDTFEWHPGMLLPGATMQVSFLKDLATQRNTQSSYTFLHYLAERDRLSDFINLQDFFPLRAEFHDYLRWASERVRVPVAYGTEASSVTWRDDAFEVHLPDGIRRARNLVLGGGIRAKLPAGVTPGRRVFHNHDLLPRLAALPSTSQRRFAVVGAGQSAAEVTAYLHETTDAEVHAVYAKFGYTPADDSPYANRIFDAETVEKYYAATPAWRERLMTYHRSTNYSAVDSVLIEDLYRREYAERVGGARRLFVHGATEVVDVIETDDAARLRTVSGLTGDTDEIECDAVIFATGFEPTPVSTMLGPLAQLCHSDVHGRPVLDRWYRLETEPEIGGSIFVQGNSEHTHGLTATLLSNVAVRAGEIVSVLADGASSVPRPAPGDAALETSAPR